MKPASALQLQEVLAPYYPAEVESVDMPLWEKWGYSSGEEFLRVHGTNILTRAYNDECTLHYLDKEKFEDAINCYEYILKTNPSYAPGWNNKGVALYYLTKYEEALVCFNKSVEIDSSL